MAGGRRCAVASCCNNVQRCKKKKLNISFHSFPREQQLKKKWIEACGRSDPIFNPNTSFVCSIHFNREDFERNLQRELMNIKTTQRLIPGAVPRFFLNGEDSILPMVSNSVCVRNDKSRTNLIQDNVKIEETLYDGSEETDLLCLNDANIQNDKNGRLREELQIPQIFVPQSTQNGDQIIFEISLKGGSEIFFSKDSNNLPTELGHIRVKTDKTDTGTISKCKDVSVTSDMKGNVLKKMKLNDDKPEIQVVNDTCIKEDYSDLLNSYMEQKRKTKQLQREMKRLMSESKKLQDNFILDSD